MAMWSAAYFRPGQAFSPLAAGRSRQHPTTTTTTTTLQMGKRKVSMAEKRKLRQAKQRGVLSPNPFADLPKPKFDFQETPASAVLDTSQKTSDPEEAAKKAQELLKTQRASVDMLTFVKERVLAIPAEELESALDRQGYYIMDGLLNDDNILTQMEKETHNMYETGALEVDMSNLGSGEYAAAVKGGQEQYVKCPRMVEWVVSTTKHIPERLAGLSLNPSACMATLRAFDRKVFLASLSLLTGGEDVPDTTKPFSKTVTGADDNRRLSLQYYIVPDSWDEACGGGLSFEAGGRVEAKRDRLVVWKSDSTSLRKDMWKGSDLVPLASYVELHLVQKSE